MLHMHDLYHMQVDGLVGDTNGFNGIHDKLREMVRKLCVHFSAERSFGELEKKRTLGQILLDHNTLKDMSQYSHENAWGMQT